MKKKTTIVEKINEITTPWGEMAPESKFGGVSLAEFKTAVAACADKRQELKMLKANISAAVNSRFAADAAAKKLIRRVVAGVVADPTLGADSDLYRAMNYVPASQRAARKTQQTTSAAAAPAVVTASSPSTK